MNLIPTGLKGSIWPTRSMRLKRLVALQHRRLEQHYGHNQIRHFQARGLATISLVLGMILIVFTIAFALMNSSFVSVAIKLEFISAKAMVNTMRIMPSTSEIVEIGRAHV